MVNRDGEDPGEVPSEGHGQPGAVSHRTPDAALEVPFTSRLRENREDGLVGATSRLGVTLAQVVVGRPRLGRHRRYPLHPAAFSGTHMPLSTTFAIVR